ncbi:hypothetical protein Sru01_17300 [Sphaerisporangium rufum]|uniref:Uncharacterized protein n=1 Tax=Sphaerisporangium rufum TaxID=1381558 RepID=A0A919R0I9_9ACTN|nr:hypothetical protein [Sphaerisporangium rufum]GII76748.1 hypothetical protein Sru01_17300 [Sphaerisporangium rufum]
MAISGHRGLPADTTALVDEAIRKLLVERGRPVRGISCLADGADQIFARAVLDLGGTLEAVIGSAGYRAGLPAPARGEFDALVTAARRVHRLPFAEPTNESYMQASRHMLDLAGELFAVWDGRPARGYGGTADVVAEARGRGMPVLVIWPDGARRE